MATRVDFYQLSRDPVERVAAMLARKVLQAGQRLLVVSGDPGQRAVIGRELWRGGPEEFLANGEADAGQAERQPILLSDKVEAANGANMVLLADGQWRPEALQFERALLLFGAAETEAARALWRELDGAEEVAREIHKQDEAGRWRAGA
ncbi:DNA polymerase III subunit chi [Altererythrobacter sp. Z27]|uniref:DNA polymerase III subunit chi n=1 Tax=Altererythrobacter sp. Z27 TaxID=3461147 RepID=UPI004043B7E5